MSTKTPSFIPVSRFMIIASPLMPFEARLYGDKNRLKARATKKVPITTVMYRLILVFIFPHF